MFVIVPWSQTNGCCVGRPVLELAVEFVNDHPTTKSLRSLLQPPVGKESAPPKVPRSCITPCLQMNACVGERQGPRGKESIVASTVAIPTTSPALLKVSPALSRPARSVPRATISVPFHTTACSCGFPVCGSISAVPEPPVAQPRALIEVAWLKFTPGSVPRSVRIPSCHRKACVRKQSTQFGALGSCIGLSDPPTTTPGLLMN